jgi:hypothetical protein
MANMMYNKSELKSDVFLSQMRKKRAAKIQSIDLVRNSSRWILFKKIGDTATDHPPLPSPLRSLPAGASIPSGHRLSALIF